MTRPIWVGFRRVCNGSKTFFGSWGRKKRFRDLLCFRSQLEKVTLNHFRFCLFEVSRDRGQVGKIWNHQKADLKKWNGENMGKYTFREGVRKGRNSNKYMKTVSHMKSKLIFIISATIPSWLEKIRPLRASVLEIVFAKGCSKGSQSCGKGRYSPNFFLNTSGAFVVVFILTLPWHESIKKLWRATTSRTGR